MKRSFDFPLQHQISRRTLLKLAGVSTFGGVLGYSRFAKPQPTVFQQDSLSLPNQVSHPKRVVIIGGGLAGLACAYELSQRGFQVTLLERAAQLGARLPVGR
ncbi:MAG: FAD-dependent oxidoreductase, partial [Leptolyngbyaceae cyanobacterium RU_5_1]|nr:FAD-dependent oxidoreductase [Leptolyngbyaceae cyanobacterium RU_5_1]